MTKIALITGATAGLGAEFARQLAAQQYSLVLVARNTERLRATANELSQQYSVQCEVLAADLLEAEGLNKVETRVAATEHPVDLLINNAGFGLLATFDESSVIDEQRLLDILVAAPMRLTHAALKQMIARPGSTIINVASVAAYTPRGTYGAAKAWLINFSRWANINYRHRGVTVTAVVPGFVRTEFHERMDASTDTIPAAMWLTAEQVVTAALKAAKRGKAVTIPTLRYKVVVALTRILPKRVMAAGALRRQ